MVENFNFSDDYYRMIKLTREEFINKYSYNVEENCLVSNNDEADLSCFFNSNSCPAFSHHDSKSHTRNGSCKMCFRKTILMAKFKGEPEKVLYMKKLNTMLIECDEFIKLLDSNLNLSLGFTHTLYYNEDIIYVKYCTTKICELNIFGNKIIDIVKCEFNKDIYKCNDIFAEIQEKIMNREISWR